MPISRHPTDAEDAFALFNQCMADHGIEGGISVSVGGDASSGAVQIDEMEPGEIDPQAGSGSIDDFDMEDLDAANKACEGHLANIDAGFDLTPEQQAAFDDAQLEFNDCMAEHGVEVPDLGSGSGGIVVGRAVASEDGDPQAGGLNLDDQDFDFEAFDKAAKACDFVFEQVEDLNP